MSAMVAGNICCESMHNHVKSRLNVFSADMLYKIYCQMRVPQKKYDRNLHGKKPLEKHCREVLHVKPS